MSPKEFAERVANNGKFYDTVTGKIVTILEGIVDITGEAYGETDDGEIIKVNAKNLESTDQKNDDKRTDTEKLADLLKGMGINPEDVGVNTEKIEDKKKSNLRNSMSPKEFAERVANNEKFYDTVTGKIVTVVGAVDITGETYGETDDGEIIKVNAKKLESIDQKSDDKRTDTEKLADLLRGMGINPEDVGVGIEENIKPENEEGVSITPENIEEATSEVTAPNFSKAITDITNGVKGKPEEDKDKSDGETKADE